LELYSLEWRSHHSVKRKWRIAICKYKFTVTIVKTKPIIDEKYAYENGLEFYAWEKQEFHKAVHNGVQLNYH